MTIRHISTTEAPWGVPVVMEEVTDPEIIAKSIALRRAFRKNVDWFDAHRDELIPQALERFLAICEEEPFIASTPEEARKLALAAHPHA